MKRNALTRVLEQRPDGIEGPLEEGYCQVCGVYECLVHNEEESQQRLSALHCEAGESLPKVASNPDESREEFTQRMQAEGCVVVAPKPFQLFVDIDNKTHLEAFLRSIGILQRDHPGVHWHSMPSRSNVPGREHITVYMPWGMDEWERIAWQGALGSDPVREVLSCLRAHKGDPMPTLFAEKKD